jgi:hypothetical protein
MRTRMHIIFVAGVALTGATMLSTPSEAQSGATLGVPNVTAPNDPVRQGAAGINAAEAETTRTTGNAEHDARATAENAEAGVGDPTLGVSAPTLGVSANANAPGQSTAANTNAMNRASNQATRNEREITRELNRQQASLAATASGNLSTR